MQAKQINVTDDREVAEAVRRGEVEGEVYRGGEVWCSVEALKIWSESCARKSESTSNT